MDETVAYLPGLSPVASRELCARFGGGRLSSDGGILVLREVEKRLGLAERLAGCLTDRRVPASTTHSYAGMIGARLFAIACGYEDCDDLDVLRFDPVFKLACGRRVEIIVRGDSHYGTPEVMDLLDDHGCGYSLGLAGNPRLNRIGQPWSEDAAVRRARSGKDRLRRFFQTGYRTESWSRERKVIARVEATARGTDVRFVVTNLPGRARLLYEKVCCARGRMENMIKEHKLYTRSDRTSCHRWEANQFRLFLHTGAYWLLHQLRRGARRGARRRSRWYAEPSSRSPSVSRN